MTYVQCCEWQHVNLCALFAIIKVISNNNSFINKVIHRRLFVTYCKYLDIISTTYMLHGGLLLVSWSPVPI